MRRKASFSEGNPLYATKRPVTEAREYVKGIPSLDLKQSMNFCIILRTGLVKFTVIMYR